MTRPFRVHRPTVSNALLRPLLLRALLARFETRVVEIRAGAGFGKTTALSQAVEQNLIAPRGHDLWLGCEPADADAGHLLQGLTEAVGTVAPATRTEAGDPDAAERTTTDRIDAIADALAAYSPAQVALLLDDVHEIPPGSGGAQVLEALIAAMPTNAHVVLAGRTAAPVALARLEAQGRVSRLDERDLALDDQALAALATAAGRPTDDVAHLGGWPALVALALRSGAVTDFLDQEVLTTLDSQQRTLLAVAVGLGGASARMLAAVTGIEPHAHLADLPMIQHHDGWYRAHDLWRQVFDPATVAQASATHRRPAVDYLLAHDQPVRAVDLALLGDDDELITRALRHALIAGRVEDPETLKRWHDLLGSPVNNHPAATHLTGLLEQSNDPTTDRCREAFERAAAGFGALGDTEAQVSSIAELAFWHHIQRDATGLVAVAGQMMELASTEPTAAPYIDIIGAFAALAQGDPHAMMAAVGRARVNPMSGRFVAVADWLEFQAHEFLGNSDVELADRYLAGAGAIRGTEVIAISARWRAGRIAELLQEPDAWGARSGSERARFLSHAWLAAVSAGCGRLAEARRHLTLATSFAGERGAKQVELSLALPETLIIHEEGDRAAAEEMLRATLERIPLADDTRLSYNGSGALIARHAPEALGALSVPLPERDLSLGRALRSMDETGELDAFVDLAWPANNGMLLSSLFLSTSCEFIAAAWAADRPEAAGAAEWMLEVIGDVARERFRDQTDHRIPRVAEAAREILASVPLPPAEPRRIELLGSERLWLGETPSDHDDWRRERVRSLLGYLVVHPDTTRDAVMTALWPEANEDAARRNLRSTLNLLLGVIEARRSGGDAAYFVRADSSRIRLAGRDRLDVDLWRFDALLDEAERLEADGAPSLALEQLTQAIELYRGALLSGVNEGEWLFIERQRLHVRFVAAAIRTGELLLAHDRVDEAISVASRTIAIEPWSEPAHRILVAAHLQRNDRAAAHRAMQRCREALDEIGGPVEELTEMLERRLSGA